MESRALEARRQLREVTERRMRLAEGLEGLQREIERRHRETEQRLDALRSPAERAARLRERIDAQRIGARSGRWTTTADEG
jgi:hypothetical protein